MKVRFLGPLGRVTGSCAHIIDGHGRELLVDCGIVQGEADCASWNDGPLPFDASKLFAVFLTHAHIDHCGLIPRLYKEGYAGEVYCTEETATIAKIVLLDNVRIGKASFSKRDVDAVRWSHPRFPDGFSSFVFVAKDLALSFVRTGHIVGAVSLTLQLGPKGPDQRRILFSGDLGPNTEGAEHQALMGHRMEPRTVDYGVCESTYGDKVREPMSHTRRLDALEAALSHSIDAGGTAILPVFAIGRAQDVLFDITWLAARNPKQYAGVDVVFHSKMGVQVSAEYAKALTQVALTKNGEVRPTWRNKQLSNWLGLGDTDAHHAALEALLVSVFKCQPFMPADPDTLPPLVRNWRTVHRIIRPGDFAPYHPDGRPRIVIAAGGMCEGGAVVRYLDGCLRDPRTTVVFTGYQGKGTLGEQLQRLKDTSNSQRKRLQDDITYRSRHGNMAMERRIAVGDIAAHFVQLSGYSAHADQSELLKWLMPANVSGARGPVAPTVFLTHGTDRARAALAKSYRAAAPEYVRVEMPSDQHWFDLASGQYEEVGAQIPNPEHDAPTLLLRLRRANDWIRWAEATGTNFPFDLAALWP